jgi:transporter family-2 protein
MFSLLAIANGLLTVWARVVNARLSDYVGDLRGSLVNHAVGLFVVAALLLLGIGSGAVRVTGIPPVYLSGGIFGVLVVAASNYAVRHAGAVLFSVLVLTFQLIGSALIDHFGWLGQTPIALSWSRVLGLVLLVVGAVIVVTDQETIQSEEGEAAEEVGTDSA